MSGPLIGTLAIAGMLALIALRVPIAVSMLIAGVAGYVSLSGWTPLLSYVKTSPYFQFSSYSLSVVPLFLLMGNLASHAGISRAIFNAANSAVGFLRGGLSMAAIAACAMFGAICGSSLATAATMGRVALPEMKRYRYAGDLATGTLAAGGTLGILIPPSIALVIYAILTEQNIAKMFLAAFVPGGLAALGYMVAIAIYVRLRPGSAPAAERPPRRERWRSYLGALPAAGVFVVVIGGIYAGVFTPTEGAAFGVLGTGLIAVCNRTGLSEFFDCLAETAVATAMIYMILLGADILNAFLALTQLPQNLAQWVGESGLSATLVITLILVLYLLLGCIMDALSMILLTIPIFFPVIMSLDFGLSPEETAIWFGVVTLVVVEVGLITPPVGMNVFIINKLARDVPMRDTFRGVVPFLLSDLVRIVLLVAFPSLTLFLVRMLM